MRHPVFPDVDSALSESHTYALLGALCGGGIVVAGWSADLAVRGLAPGLEALGSLLATNPLHWLLLLAAPGLATFGWVLGRERDRTPAAQPPAPAFDLAAHVLSYSTEAMLVLDRNGVIVTATPAVGRLLGWDARNLTGQGADVLLCGFFDGGVAPRPVPSPGDEVLALEWCGQAQCPDGTRFPVSARSLPGAAPGGLRVVTIHDASALAHQSQELSNSKAENANLRQQVAVSHHASAGSGGLEFFAKQVHELRNPLAVITALSAFVLEQLEQRGIGDLVQDMRDMVTASERLRALVDRTLDLSKIEAGRMSVLLEPVEIEPLVDELIQQTRPVAAERRNALVLDLAPGLGRVFADPMRLRQVLANLLSNACKFTKDGRITLRIEHRDVLDDPLGPRVMFHVIDTGIGMSPEQASRVFGEFEQASSDTRRDYGGTGLGLALVQRFSRMMSGDVRVTSQQGQGTTFTVELPAVIEQGSRSDSAA